MSNLVEIRDLNIRFTGERTVHAVNDISLTLGEGEGVGVTLCASTTGEANIVRAMKAMRMRRCFIFWSWFVQAADEPVGDVIASAIADTMRRKLTTCYLPKLTSVRSRRV